MSLRRCVYIVVVVVVVLKSVPQTNNVIYSVTPAVPPNPAG